MKYFWDPPGREHGINADLARHDKEKVKLEAKLKELESQDTPMSAASARAYRHFLVLLANSRDQVANKLGRTKT